jgi:hypothetical protein
MVVERCIDEEQRQGYLQLARVGRKGERFENTQGNYDFPEAHANGYLLAASKDMYEALVAVTESRGYDEDWALPSGLIEAALAKARGEVSE